MDLEWTLTDIEFRAAWLEQKEGSALPMPLFALGRVADRDEFDRRRVRARDRLRAEYGRELDRALETLARPDIRLTVSGWEPETGAATSSSANPLRITAARRGGTGVVVRQLPDDKPDYAKAFKVALCPATELASAAVAEIPTASAGGLDPVTLPDATQSVDYAYGRSSVHVNAYGDSTPMSRARDFLATPPTWLATIEIHQARSKYGPRGLLSYRLECRDIEGDGRYVITAETPPVARPVDDPAMTATLNSYIARIVEKLRDEGDGE